MTETFRLKNETKVTPEIKLPYGAVLTKTASKHILAEYDSTKSYITFTTPDECDIAWKNIKKQNSNIEWDAHQRF